MFDIFRFLIFCGGELGRGSGGLLVCVPLVVDGETLCLGMIAVEYVFCFCFFFFYNFFLIFREIFLENRCLLQ